jgi:hypothetical protein
MAVYRETVLDAQDTEAVAGTVQRGVITSIGAGSLENIDELFVYLDVTTAVTGGALDIYLQRAVVPNPVAATDAHWTDFLHFAQVAAGATSQQIAPGLPMTNAPAVSVSTDATRAREHAAIVADASIAGHWGDQLRIVEKIGAGVTVAGVYSIHMTGRDNL